jgi:hypothetical protein
MTTMMPRREARLLTPADVDRAVDTIQRMQTAPALCNGWAAFTDNLDCVGWQAERGGDDLLDRGADIWVPVVGMHERSRLRQLVLGGVRDYRDEMRAWITDDTNDRDHSEDDVVKTLNLERDIAMLEPVLEEACTFELERFSRSGFGTVLRLT